MLLIRGRLGFAIQQEIKADNSQQKAYSSDGWGFCLRPYVQQWLCKYC